MDNNQIGSILQAITDMQGQHQKAIARLSEISGAFDSKALLKMSSGAYLDVTREASATLRALGTIPKFPNIGSPALDALGKSQRGLIEEVSRSVTQLSRDLELNKQAVGTLINPIPRTQIAGLSELSGMFSEMQKVALVSHSLVGSIDWRIIKPRYQFDASALVKVQNAFSVLSRAQDALFHTTEDPLGSIAIASPDLVRRTILDYHNTAESIGVVVSLPDIPEIDGYRRDLIDQQTHESANETEALLHELNPAYVDAWRGAEAALQSGHIDHERHWSASVRELLTHVLHALSPDEAIKKWTSETGDYDRGRPTRKCRVRYICRGVLSRKRKEFSELLEKDIDCFVETMNILQGGTHGMPPTLDSADLPILKVRIESMLCYLIKIAKEVRE